MSPMKPSHRWMMIMGGLLALGAPVAGMVLTVLGMAQSVEALGMSGTGDPSVLSASIGHTLLGTAGGQAVGSGGLVWFLVGLILWLSGRRKPHPAPMVST